MSETEGRDPAREDDPSAAEPEEEQQQDAPSARAFPSEHAADLEEDQSALLPDAEAD